jgi:hypothetical protein
MRLFVFPLLALGVLVSGYTDEPTEGQMKRAFEASLAMQVRDVMDFVAETNGPQAVQEIRQAGNDQFAIRTFRKIDCAPAERNAGYICSFAVDIKLVNGDLERQLNGHFSPSVSGLAFASDV